MQFGVVFSFISFIYILNDLYRDLCEKLTNEPRVPVDEIITKPSEHYSTFRPRSIIGNAKNTQSKIENLRNSFQNYKQKSSFFRDTNSFENCPTSAPALEGNMSMFVNRGSYDNYSFAKPMKAPSKYGYDANVSMPSRITIPSNPVDASYSYNRSGSFTVEENIAPVQNTYNTYAKPTSGNLRNQASKARSIIRNYEDSNPSRMTSEEFIGNRVQSAIRRAIETASPRGSQDKAQNVTPKEIVSRTEAAPPSLIAGILTSLTRRVNENISSLPKINEEPENDIGEAIKQNLYNFLDSLPSETIRKNSTQIIDSVSQLVASQLVQVDDGKSVVDANFIADLIYEAIDQAIRSQVPLSKQESAELEAVNEEIRRSIRNSLQAINNRERRASVLSNKISQGGDETSKVSQKNAYSQDNRHGSLADIDVQTTNDKATDYSCPCSDPNCFKFHDFNFAIPQCIGAFPKGHVPQTLVFCTGCPCSPKNTPCPCTPGR